MPAEPGILHVVAKSRAYKASCHGSQDCLGDITGDCKHWFTKGSSNDQETKGYTRGGNKDCYQSSLTTELGYAVKIPYDGQSSLATYWPEMSLLPECYWPECFNIPLHNTLPTIHVIFCENPPVNNMLIHPLISTQTPYVLNLITRHMFSYTSLSNWKTAETL